MTDYKIQTDEVLKFLANIDDKDLDYVKVSTSVARDMAHELQTSRAQIGNLRNELEEDEKNTKDNIAQLADNCLRIMACESALISMVQQYCYIDKEYDKSGYGGYYTHDYMSAGEEAFRYLIKYNLAKKHKHNKSIIYFVEEHK